MKIAVFFNLPSGGAKRALYEQVKRLSKNHAIDVYTLSTANHDFCDLRKFVKNYYIYNIYTSEESWLHFIQPATVRGVLTFPINLYNLYIHLPRLQKQIAEKINKTHYDLAFVNPDLFTQAPYILRYLKIPSVYYCTEPKREFYEYIPRMKKKFSYYFTLPFRYPLKFIDRNNIKQANLVLTNSYYSKKLIEKVYEIKAHVNYLGIDSDKFKRSPNIKKENIVLTVGGFNLLKGHDFVIKSLGLIEQSKRPHLVVVGNGGEDEDYLYNLAEKLGVNIKLISDTTDEELVKWYNKAKLFVYFPHQEPFGFAPLEAISSGLPVIAIAEAGTREILKEFENVSLIYRDLTILSTKITRMLLEHNIYPNMERDIDIIRNKYSWDKSVRELEKYIQMITSKKSPPRRSHGFSSFSLPPSEVS